MHLTRITRLAPLILIFLASPTAAGDDASDILDYCATAERVMENPNVADTGISSIEFGICIGFIRGFIHTQIYHNTTMYNGKGAFCAPGMFSPKDLVYMFNSYIRKNPHMRVAARSSPVQVLVSALQESWPCRTKR